jgi:Tfp pilus assembly protein PilO
MFKERKQIMIFAATAMLLCGFVLLRYLPLQHRLKAAKERIVNAQLVISKASTEKEKLELVKQELLEAQAKVIDFDKNVPVQRDLGGFLQQITEMMTAHNLKEQIIEPDSEIKTEKLNCVPVTIQCKGKLKQIFEFYKSLQKMERLVRIEEIQLKNDNNLTGEASMLTKTVIFYRRSAEQG